MASQHVALSFYLLPYIDAKGNAAKGDSNLLRVFTLEFDKRKIVGA
jgi:hypothetical protein